MRVRDDGLDSHHASQHGGAQKGAAVVTSSSPGVALSGRNDGIVIAKCRIKNVPSPWDTVWAAQEPSIEAGTEQARWFASSSPSEQERSAQDHKDARQS